MTDIKLPKLLNARSNDCPSLGTNDCPPERYPKVSIGITVEKYPKLGSQGETKDGVGLSSWHRRHELDENVIKKNRDPEISENTTKSRTLNAKDVKFQHQMPTPMKTLSGNQASTNKSQDRMQEKTGCIASGIRLEQAANTEMHVLHKGVNMVLPDKMIKHNNEGLKAKLQEILNMASESKQKIELPKPEDKNAINSDQSGKFAQSHQIIDSPVVRDRKTFNKNQRKVRQRKSNRNKMKSDTIETDSESPNEIIRRPLTRSLTQKKASSKTFQKLCQGSVYGKIPLSSSSESKQKLGENNIFTFDGVETKLVNSAQHINYNPNGFKGMKRELKKKGFELPEVHFPEMFSSVKILEANGRGQTVPSPDEATHRRQETRPSANLLFQHDHDKQKTSEKGTYQQLHAEANKNLIPELVANSAGTRQHFGSPEKKSSRGHGKSWEPNVYLDKMIKHDNGKPQTSKKDPNHQSQLEANAHLVTPFVTSSAETQDGHSISLKKKSLSCESVKSQTPNLFLEELVGHDKDTAQKLNKDPNFYLQSEVDKHLVTPLANSAETQEESGCLRRTRYSCEQVETQKLNFYQEKMVEQEKEKPEASKKGLKRHLQSEADSYLVTPLVTSTANIQKHSNSLKRKRYSWEHVDSEVPNNVYLENKVKHPSVQKTIPLMHVQDLNIAMNARSPSPRCKLLDEDLYSPTTTRRLRTSSKSKFMEKHKHKTDSLDSDMESVEQTVEILESENMVLLSEEEENEIKKQPFLSPNKCQPSDFFYKETEEPSGAYEVLEQYPEDSLERAVIQLALVLQRFKTKIRSQICKKSSDILSDVREKVCEQLQHAESRIEKDIGKFLSAGKLKEKCLESKFREQQERLEFVHNKFKEEVGEHLHVCRNTFEEIEAYKIQLKGGFDKQQASHKQLIGQVEEEIESQITNAEMRVAALHNNANRSLSKLKHVLREWMLERST
ncbi:meiosis-specific protein PAIR3-like isoform X1 [Zingiber officinale]|uniref:meiosis-specific protein PAIR3-like isoform X1 n=1 Tax=Zingiber officinale TaxID=94328 RepID=UPI001C4C3740|nr:meiosis-specific protein PAIR3-like isoform X1 [Zingiber officinale]